MNNELKLRAIGLFKQIQAEFPQFVMEYCDEDPDVVVSVTIRQQIGLAFDVHLSLQNDDELHLCAGSFWCSWFPLSRPVVLQNYHDAVVGVFTGRDRVVEYVRRSRVVAADLQTPSGGRWETVAKSRRNLLPLAWFSKKRILINK